MKKICLFVVSTFSTCTFGQTLWSSNGHYYQYVPTGPISWTTAKASAESATYLGLTGHLATPTTLAENQFIVSTFGWSTVNLAWLGGYQDESAPDYSEPAGGWRWVTGEAWTYSVWPNGQQPNNAGGSPTNNTEGYLQYWYRLSPAGSWNDEANFHPTDTHGYVIEYEAVPEPSALLGLTLPLIALAITRRHKGI